MSAEYDVDESGIIRTPGRFEGDPSWVPAFHEIWNEGGADRELHDTHIGVTGDWSTTGLFLVDDEDRAMYPALKNTYAVALWVLESGFVNARTFEAQAEYDEWIKAAEEKISLREVEEDDDLDAAAPALETTTSPPLPPFNEAEFKNVKAGIMADQVSEFGAADAEAADRIARQYFQKEPTPEPDVFDHTPKPLKQLAADELDLDPDHYPTVNKWLARGDGIAVYENVALDSAGAGHRKFLSYGSKDASFETDAPPKILPDTATEINWRYHLVGVYRGAPLSVPAPSVSSPKL